ncbi:MAG: Fe-S cluster assembly protein SufD [Anaerolineales bacterium]|nr:Fe-S cluster assembly protein SufD [Anaerolineales bacterium]
MARKQPEKGFTFSRDMIAVSEEVPTILREHRSKAWQAYQDLPFPTMKDEAWRRTSLSNINFGAIQLPNGNLSAAIPKKISGRILSENLLSKRSTALLSPAGVEINQSAQLKKIGVVFSSLVEAAEKHPELIAKVLGQIVSPLDGKFAAVTSAFAEQGVFIYVPKGVDVEDPIFGITFTPWENTAHFFQTLIYLEEGSSLTYIQESLSPEKQTQPSLAGENVEIYVGKNARLKIAELQTYGDMVWSFGHKKALVERDGYLEWKIGALGSSLSKHFITVDLIGQGAEGRVSGAFFADQKQHLSYNTLQRHLAPRTTSDLLFKGALAGESRSVWRGMIYVAPGARHIDGYQANRNLLLNRDARSDSIPGLEILNNDVRCTHGSTVGKIDQEQLFYLLSRGIPRKEAEQLIIQGFFDDIFSRFSIPEVGERLWQSIKSRLAID